MGYDSFKALYVDQDIQNKINMKLLNYNNQRKKVVNQVRNKEVLKKCSVNIKKIEDPFHFSLENGTHK